MPEGQIFVLGETDADHARPWLQHCHDGFKLRMEVVMRTLPIADSRELVLFEEGDEFWDLGTLDPELQFRAGFAPIVTSTQQNTRSSLYRRQTFSEELCLSTGSDAVHVLEAGPT